MSRPELPKGISPTNEKQSFATPDMASPGFSVALRSGAKLNSIQPKHDFVEQVIDDEDDYEKDEGANRAPKARPSPILVMIILAGLLTALAAIVIANKQQPTPLCADQPSWNQFNCRPG